MITRTQQDIVLASGHELAFVLDPFWAKPVVLVAIQLLDISIEYQKWGGPQAAAVGDWIVNKVGETYTIAAAEFAATYVPTGVPHEYRKFVKVMAVQAYEPGHVLTLEGQSEFAVGDYIAQNPTGEFYVIPQAKFERLYTHEEPVA